MKILASLLLAIPAFVYAANSAAPADTLDAKVRHQLELLPYYTVFDDLSYRIDGDQVTLSGEVAKPSLRNEAISAIKEVTLNVRDEIEVLPLSAFDDNIRVKTFYAIYGYGPLFPYSTSFRGSIHILVKNGNVTLTGWVNNKMDKDLAGMRANMVSGSFSVKNDLRIVGA